MKIKQLILLLLLFVAMEGRAQTIDKIKGLWAGKYYENAKEKPVSCDIKFYLSKPKSPFITGKLTLENWTDGRPTQIIDKEFFYSIENGNEGLLCKPITIIQSGGASVSAMVHFVFINENGQKVLRGGVFPDQQGLVYNKVDIILYSEKDKESIATLSPYNPILAKSAERGVRPSTANTVQNTSGALIHLAANPVYLKADQLYNFNDGYAVISKGGSQALIDATGKIVIPYNKYKFGYNSFAKDGVNYKRGMTVDTYGFLNGFIVVQDLSNNLWGLMDTNLRLTIPCIYLTLDDGFTNDGYVTATRKTTQYNTEHVYLTYAGKIITSGDKPYYGRINVVRGANGKWGYQDAFGNLKIGFEFDKAMPFSNGMAAVARPNEFNEMKWGFINTAGKLMVPFVFSNQPGDFNDGRALVFPVVTDDFEYAYINKSGKVVISTKKPSQQCGFDPSFVEMISETYAKRKRGAFMDGYAMWHDYCGGIRGGAVLMDTLGNRNYFVELVKRNNWPSNNATTLTEFINKEVLISSRSGVRYEEIFAIANVKGDIIIRTSDKEGAVLGYIESLFDPISQLSRVKLNPGMKNEIYGYCNRNGEIVLVKGAEEKW